MIKTSLRFLLNTLVFLLMFMYVLFSENGFGLVPSLPYTHILAVVVMGNATGFLIFFLNKLLNRVIDRENRTGLIFVISFVLDYLFGVIILILLTRIYLILFTNIPTDTFFSNNKESVIRVLILTSSILLIYLIIDFLVYSYNKFSRIKIDGITGKRKQLQLQVEALKTQLSPHYLFNSLNTISALLYTSPTDTEVFIRNLSETYRYIISTHSKQLIALQKEMQFVNDYLQLLKVRFGSSIVIENNIPPEKQNGMLPPMSIQLLIENAIKHNIFSDEEKLFIEILLKGNDSIIVRNNIMNHPPELSSFKIGLNNIKSQYGFLTKREIIVKKDTHFTVELPLILKQAKEV